MKKILQQNEKILREIAKEVPLTGIKSTKIKKVLEEMKKSLKSQDDGVAIAAPQIGYSLRIFIVSGKIFEKDFLSNRKERMSGEREKSDVIEVKTKIKDVVFINPKITKLSRTR